MLSPIHEYNRITNMYYTTFVSQADNVTLECVLTHDIAPAQYVDIKKSGT